MTQRGWTAILALVCVLVATPALAQGGGSTATLTGVVVDKDGGVVPGATVTIRNNATGETLNVVTNTAGAWSFPGLSIGTYTVTIALTGFKSAEYKDVRLLAGSSNNIKTTLEIGQFQEVVSVSAGTDLIRTQTPTVSSTITSDFVNTLPRSDRNALSFLVFLPGVETIGNSTRNSEISGLPRNTINITIDGISTSNLLQSNDGFFSLVTPRLDAVEEVTMTSATAGADATGQGAVQIRFQTRSGTNRFETSLYSYLQHANLNSNTFFNALNGLPVPEATNYTYGGRVGGPIILPGLFDGRGKAFFFFNLEEVYAPAERARARTIIRQSALDGNFTYNLSNPRTVNVLALAAANNQVATYDPTIKTLLESIRAAAQTTGTIEELITSPNHARFNYLVPNKGIRHTPTQSITLNLTPNHRLQGSYYWQYFNNTPDTLNSAEAVFPGFPLFGDQASYRTSASITMRSTFSSSMVNELRGGWQWSPVDFFTNTNPGMFANQGGYSVDLNFGLSNPTPGFGNSPQDRNTANWTIDNTFSWLKGSHSLMFGGNFTRVNDEARNWNNVPSITIGLDTGNDPAESMFTSANFPGSSSGDRNDARQLYALLTGRVTAVSATGRLNPAGDEYIYNGPIERSERMDEYSFFAQDQWRLKSTVTLTAGLRYQLQMPVVPTNGVFTAMSIESACGPSGFGDGPFGTFCNMFNPGDIRNPDVEPEYFQYSPNVKGYNTDKNNFAPNVGISWRPNVQAGFMRGLLGDPEIATISAGYSRSFNRERLDRFLNIYNGNPGQTVPATRSSSANAFPLVLPGEQWPVLFRETSRLGEPDFQRTPVFPMPAARNQDMFVFDPNIIVPHTDSWSVSFQRSLDRNTVAELRYVGNVNRNAWLDTQSWNIENMFETGLLDEFQVAQANLRANVLAGNGGTFAYTGAPGTSPLPLFLAHFSGTTDAGNLSAYSSTQWTNSTWVNRLDPFDPDPQGIAANLYGGSSGAWFENAMGVGYASNFWVMNPLVDDVEVTWNDPGGVRNHQVIAELRRRLSAGLAVQGSYTYHRQYDKGLQEMHLPLFDLRTTGVPHAFKMLWTYDIPFGRGRRFGANVNRFVDYVAGGWTFSGAGRVQVQSFVLRNSVLVGMNLDEARDALKEVRVVTDPLTGATTVWNFPQDIIDNTRKAYNTDPREPTFYAPGEEPTGRYFAPAGGPGCNFLFPGDCDTNELWFNGRWFSEFDFRINKMIPIGAARFEISAEVFNALRAFNFPVSLSPSNSANVFRITSTQSGARTAQVVFRVSW